VDLFTWSYVDANQYNLNSTLLDSWRTGCAVQRTIDGIYRQIEYLAPIEVNDGDAIAPIGSKEIFIYNHGIVQSIPTMDCFYRLKLDQEKIKFLCTGQFIGYTRGNSVADCNPEVGQNTSIRNNENKSDVVTAENYYFVANRSCPYIYVDMGTNIGHQIRKLYEPRNYFRNPVDEIIYRKYFPAQITRQTICAFGFEPNPIHTKRLKELEESYSRIQVPVHIYTDTACGIRDENITFYRDPGAASHNEWGAGVTTSILTDKSHLVTTQVHAINMAVWFQSMLRNSAQGLNPLIVMKSDIEGYDETVLGHLLKSGILCNITVIYGEHVSSEWWAEAEKQLRSKGCKTVYVHLDDEYGDEHGPLPLPHSIILKERRNFPDGTLLRSGQSKEIFLVQNSSVHSFPNWETFVSKGYDINSKVIMVHPVEFANIPVGESVK